MDIALDARQPNAAREQGDCPSQALSHGTWTTTAPLRLAHQPQVSALSQLPFTIYTNRQHWFSHLEAFLNSFPKFRTIDKVKLKRVQLESAISGANVRHERRLNKIRSKCPMPVLNQTVTIFPEKKIEKKMRIKNLEKIINEKMLKIFAYRKWKKLSIQLKEKSKHKTFVVNIF